MGREDRLISYEGVLFSMAFLGQADESFFVSSKYLTLVLVDKWGVTEKSAKRSVERLVDAQILEEEDGKISLAQNLKDILRQEKHPWPVLSDKISDIWYAYDHKSMNNRIGDAALMMEVSYYSEGQKMDELVKCLVDKFDLTGLMARGYIEDGLSRGMLRETNEGLITLNE